MQPTATQKLKWSHTMDFMFEQANLNSPPRHLEGTFILRSSYKQREMPNWPTRHKPDSLCSPKWKSYRSKHQNTSWLKVMTFIISVNLTSCWTVPLKTFFQSFRSISATHAAGFITHYCSARLYCPFVSSLMSVRHISVWDTVSAMFQLPPTILSRFSETDETQPLTGG